MSHLTPPYGSNRIHKSESVEYLSPAHISSRRQATLPSAVFSLVSTIVGGGVLSLPFAFASTGVLLGPVFLVLIAVASNFSIYILISCSRRTPKGSTYEEVAYAAFGTKARVATVVLVFALIYLCVIAYLILLRDLLIPLVEFVLQTILTPEQRILALALAVIAIFPMCLMKSLNALRFTSVTSQLSILILFSCIAYRTIQKWTDPSQHLSLSTTPIKLYSSSIHEALYAFPIISVAYLCHFNVLPLHSELIEPTRIRVKSLINWVILLCTCMYFLIGLTGYLYALDATSGNILNNFPSDDPIITLGRMALLFTVSCVFPLLVLPCRTVMIRLWGLVLEGFGYWKNGAAVQNRHEYEQIGDNHSQQQQQQSSINHINGNSTTSSSSTSTSSSSLEEGSHASSSSSDNDTDPSPLLNFLQTFFILFTCFLFAVNVKTVATMWSLVGSTVSIIIAYIMPALFYIRIRRKKGLNLRMLCAWLLLIGGIVSLCVCSYGAIYALIYPVGPSAEGGAKDGSSSSTSSDSLHDHRNAAAYGGEDQTQTPK